MAENSYTAGGDDDMPRTVRQLKEARARELMKAPRPAVTRAAPRMASLANNPLDDEYARLAQSPPGEDPAAMVTRLQVPFFHLMGFLLKAVLAGVPALVLAVLLMMGIFWGAGQAVEHYVPWLVKMRIIVTFPN